MQIKTNSIVDVVYRIFVKEGNVTPVYRYSLLIIGVAVIFFDIKIWNTGWVFYLGLVFASVGGYSARAAQLNIRPFDRAPYPPGWLKARKEERMDKTVKDNDRH
ncbi:hypothetical protein ACFWXM_18790 [Achromobacter xylosoxidans]|uniref:hypothetical protein n=1 Tax=Alcaligenes xylosoxydans xylosoxydans TaxID=85698 RepID=UPI003762DC6C